MIIAWIATQLHVRTTSRRLDGGGRCRAAMWLAIMLLAGCGDDDAKPDDGAVSETRTGRTTIGEVTISGDDAVAEQLNWRAPQVDLDAKAVPDACKQADKALGEGRLHEDASAAIPLYLAILRVEPEATRARNGLQRAMSAVLAQGSEQLEAADEDAQSLRQAQLLAAVARYVAPQLASQARSNPRSKAASKASSPVNPQPSPQQKALRAYLERVDLAERMWSLNATAESDLAAGRFGAQGGGALGGFREVLRLQPDQSRALQGIAAVESGLLRKADEEAGRGDFEQASRWIDLAARVRPGSATLADARERVKRIRQLRIASLRDAGLRVLAEYQGVRKARDQLAEILRIAEPGDPAATELRTRIDLATHYGLFRPGQLFTDALKNGGRGPQMRVVPHGGFRMGAEADETGAHEYEQPSRYLRFDRGFAMSVREVTVGEFRRYLAATGALSRAMRRGYSMPYDERSNNFVRRSGVDTGSDYIGGAAADNLPVLHVSAADADAYAQWLSAQTGRVYRLPSEAEFEYALRAGTSTRYPWGNGNPPAGAGNFTGAIDRSPGGRSWSNAISGYGDGFWGPAPVGKFSPNAFGLHDLSGNVSEWVADCWHDSFRRAPKDPKAWFNPGCRTRVIRGGAWASSPAQLRSAWRAPLERDTTNAQIGFRLVRDL